MPSYSIIYKQSRVSLLLMALPTTLQMPEVLSGDLCNSHLIVIEKGL